MSVSLLHALVCLTHSLPQAGAAPDAAVDATGDGRAFLEVVAERQRYFVEEPIAIRIRAGFERDFLQEGLIELFRRPLDVPAQIQAPWLAGLPGVALLEDVPEARTEGALRASIAVNDSSVLAERGDQVRADGQTFTVLEVRRRFLAERAGELHLPEAALRFAYGTRFEEDLLAGRRAVDRREALVRSTPLTLRVEPLPEQGRPASFTGAVGRFSVRASTETSELEVGQSLKLALTISGDGNLHRLEPPSLAGLEGFDTFRVYGVSEEGGGPAVRRFLYDLAPLSAAVESVPSIPFVFFDSSPPAGYRSVHTEPIPLRVRAASAESPTVRPPGAPDATPGEPAPASGPSRAPLTVGVLGALGVLFMGLLAAWRRKRHRRSAPPQMRAAATRLRVAIAAPDADLASVFADFLAATLGCSPAAVIAPDLAQRLEAGGAPAELAGGAARLLDELVAARYGGTPPPEGEASVLALVAALQSSARSVH